MANHNLVNPFLGEARHYKLNHFKKLFHKYETTFFKRQFIYTICLILQERIKSFLHLVYETEVTQRESVLYLKYEINFFGRMISILFNAVEKLYKFFKANLLFIALHLNK